MKNLKGKVAAVTGAASGIGQALAVNLAKEGCNLALSDVNSEGLKETECLLKQYGVKVSCHTVDVSEKDQVYNYADSVVEQHGRVDLVINNAGVTATDSVAGVSYDDFEWVMKINFWGVVYGTKAFLPHIEKQPEGHVVNISSINGFVTWPNHSPYCSAKFAVKGFSEVLLQETDGSNIRVSCVHPGGIKTNIARNARFNKAANTSLTKADTENLFEKIAMTTADKAAKIIVRGIKKDKRRILVGPDAYVLDWMTRHFPVWFVRFIGKSVKKMGS